LTFFALNGYKAFINTRKDGRRSDGVILYVRENLHVTHHQVLDVTSANVIKINLQFTSNGQSNPNNSITVILVYRDCNSRIADFAIELERIIDINVSNVIILGDVNINILNENESADYLNTVIYVDTE